jgi:hypothetical protein
VSRLFPGTESFRKFKKMNFSSPFRQEEPTYLLHKVEVMLDILVLQTLDEVLTTHAKLGLSSKKNILLQREDRLVRGNQKLIFRI